MMLEKERYCRKKGQRKRFSIIEINKIFKKKQSLFALQLLKEETGGFVRCTEIFFLKYFKIRIKYRSYFSI